ncbi:MAG: hypothetical protein U9Q22_02735 [Candidatus Altiarchaeota archaeon]|nr:hypothetical protein [Candidatus Altiarchaeota archaeon]
MKKETGKFLGNRRGILFTLAIILLIIPLIFLISFYVGTSKTKIEDTTARIRCDELHYFVEDVKRDLDRAMVIFGRRSAIYSIDYVIKPPGNPLLNYTFKCTSLCGVDCDKLIHPETGSEAAIAELALCGTLNGSNVTYMLNHTLKGWIDKMETMGENMNFRVNITLKEIKVIPIDAWHFAIIIDNKIDITDKIGACYYRESSLRAMSNTPIIGLEDPLYALSSEGKIMRYIYDCDIGLDLETVAGCSLKNWGNGSAQGYVIFYSDIKGPGPNLATYCTDNQEYVSDKIIVFNEAFGNCNTFEKSCFDNSSTYHFAGIIDYAKNAPSSFTSKCNITIPWISATGNLDNESSFGGQRDPNCSDANITNGGCVYIKNNGTVHQVLMGIDYEDINFSCYRISNITEYVTNCEKNYSNGPSFFDRLDGSYNLSEKYQNQSERYFDNSFIGIETLVNPYELVEHSVEYYANATWVDYLYWSDINGSCVLGFCMGDYPIRFDCQHMERYGLDEY